MLVRQQTQIRYMEQVTLAPARWNQQERFAYPGYQD